MSQVKKAQTALLIWILLTLLTLVFRNFGLTFNHTASGHFQFSDSFDWYGCMGVYSEKIFTFANFSINDWCLRRPTYPLIWSIPNVLLNEKTFYLVMLNQLIFSFAFAAFLKSIKVYLNLSRIQTLLVFTIVILSAINDFTSLGPELFALSISLFATRHLLKTLFTRKVIDVLLFGLLTVLAYELRPGNPLFVLCVLIVCLILIRHFSNVQTFTNKILLNAFTILVITIPYTFPRLIMNLFNQNNAFHGGNLWGTLYGLTLKNYSGIGYDAAYQNLTSLCKKCSEVNFWNFVKEQTILNFKADPASTLNHVYFNFINQLKKGLFESTFNFQSIFFDVNLDKSSGLFLSLLLILLNLAFLLIVVTRLRVQNFQKRIGVSFENLIASAILLYFILVFFGQPFLFGPAKTGFNTFGFEITFLFSLSVLVPIILFIRIFLNRKQGLNSNIIPILILICYVGEYVLFSFVGRDEPTRHQINNIPWFILGILYLTFPLNEEKNRVSNPNQVHNEMKSVHSNLFIIITFILAILTNLRSPQYLNVQDCTNLQSPIVRAKILDIYNYDERKFPKYYIDSKAYSDNWINFTLRDIGEVTLIQLKIPGDSVFFGANSGVIKGVIYSKRSAYQLRNNPGYWCSTKVINNSPQIDLAYPIVLTNDFGY